MSCDIDLNIINKYLKTQNLSHSFHFRDIVKLKGGRSNPNYLLISDAGKFVLRRQPFGKLQKSAHNLSREFQVLQALQKTTVPVPEVYHLCENLNVIGVVFYIMSYMEGEISSSFHLPQMSVGLRRDSYLNMIELLAELHKIEYRSIGLQYFGKEGNFYERQYHRWNKSFELSLPEGLVEFTKLSKWLNAHMPEGSITTLIHGDFRLDNMIFNKQNRNIEALLDWELSTLGDPLSDLGYFLGVLNAPSDFIFPGFMGIDRTALGIPSEDEMIDIYCKLTGRETIDNWSFYKAFGYFRLSSICAGIQSRVNQGNAVDDTSRLFGSLTAKIAEIGLQQIQ